MSEEMIEEVVAALERLSPAELEYVRLTEPANRLRAQLSAYNPNERLSRVETLFAAIEHGDTEHREWLKEAIDKHLAGESVPVPRGKGSDERLREALEPFAEIAGQIAAIEKQVGDEPSPDHMLRLVPMRLLRNARSALSPLPQGEKP